MELDALAPGIWRWDDSLYVERPDAVVLIDPVVPAGEEERFFRALDRDVERLGRPERCPHGWPVDPEREQAENRELAPLSDLQPGERATIVRLAEHDGDLLHWFYDQGLVPGQKVEMRTAEPAADQFTIGLDGGERAISEKAAAGLFVRPA